MSRKINYAPDFSGNELLNFRVQMLASDPDPLEARLYYSSALKVLRYHNGDEWVSLGEAGEGLTQEQVEDIVAAMFAAGTHDGVTVTYDDGSGSLSIEADVPEIPTLDQIPTAEDTVDLGDNKLTGLADGTEADDAVNLGQVLALIETGPNKAAVRVATTADVDLSEELEDGDEIDGVTLAAGDRVLVKDQTDATENGIYIVSETGAAERAPDADIDAEVTGGLSVWVNEGDTQGDTRWVLTTNDPIELGTTELTFVQDYAAAPITAGDGLTLDGNELSVETGDGLTISSGAVAVDPTVVVRGYAQDLTGGSAAEVVTHNLGTRDVQVTLYLLSGSRAEEDFVVEHTSTSTVTIRMEPDAIPASTYRVVIFGIVPAA